MITTTNPAFILALRAAADFFEANPDKRVTHVFARDAERCQVDPRDPSATCWCALGRVLVELDDETYQAAVTSAMTVAFERSPFGILEHIAAWNVIDPVWEHNDQHPLIAQTVDVVRNLRATADKLENEACT